MIPELLRGSMSQFIVQDVPTVDVEAPIADALKLFDNNPHHAVVVTWSKNQVTGLITPKDVATAALHHDIQFVRDLLKTSEELIAIRIDHADLWLALRMLGGDNDRGKPLDFLPVVDGRNVLMGLFSWEIFGRKMAEFVRRMT